MGIALSINEISMAYLPFSKSGDALAGVNGILSNLFGERLEVDLTSPAFVVCANDCYGYRFKYGKVYVTENAAEEGIVFGAIVTNIVAEVNADLELIVSTDDYKSVSAKGTGTIVRDIGGFRTAVTETTETEDIVAIEKLKIRLKAEGIIIRDITGFKPAANVLFFAVPESNDVVGDIEGDDKIGRFRGKNGTLYTGAGVASTGIPTIGPFEGLIVRDIAGF